MSAPTREQLDAVLMEFSFENAIPGGPWYTFVRDDMAKALIESLAEIVRLRTALAESEQENDDSDAVLTRQSRIMTETANALKGEPKELAMHSTHDLAEVAAQIVAELQRLRTLADDDAAVERAAVAMDDAAMEWLCHGDKEDWVPHRTMRAALRAALGGAP